MSVMQFMWNVFKNVKQHRSIMYVDEKWILFQNWNNKEVSVIFVRKRLHAYKEITVFPGKNKWFKKVELIV